MKLRSLHICLALLALVPAVLPAAERTVAAVKPGSVAFAGNSAVSTTLLEARDPPPASTAEAATGGEHYWLRPGNGVRLAFDLDSLPAGLSAAQMRRCVLRVVASEVRYVREHEAVAAVVELAKAIGRTPSQVAINWVRQQRRGVIIPILGARTLPQLRDNLASLDFELSDEHLQRLDTASAIAPGFPHDFLMREGVRHVIYGNTLPLIDNHRTRS